MVAGTRKTFQSITLFLFSILSITAQEAAPESDATESKKVDQKIQLQIEARKAEAIANNETLIAGEEKKTSTKESTEEVKSATERALEKAKAVEKDKGTEPQRDEAPLLPLPEEATTVYNLDSLKKLRVDHAKEVVFAMLGNFNGHFRIYAEQIRNGLLSHFAEVNRYGGINGKKIRLICCEDGSDPIETKKILTYITKKHKVKTFIGNMGTRSIAHILPEIKKKKIALLFPWGGSEDLFKPDLKNIINGLGDLKPQLDAIISHCVGELRFTKIAIFHSDGMFNTSAKDTLIDILKKHHISPVKVAAYNRFTMDINTPASNILKVDPKVVICLSSSLPASKLISYFFENGHYGTTFLGVDSTLMVPRILEGKGAKYSYTSTVESPSKSILDIAHKYRSNLKAYFPTNVPNILSFAYYIHAAIITHAITNGGSIENTDIIAQIEAMNDLDLGGFTVTFDPETRKAYPHVVKMLEG